MSILTEMALDHQEAEEDYGNQVITWGGADYLCVPGAIDTETQIEIGGNPVAISGTFMCRKSVFPNSTPPASGDIVTYNAIDYKVVSVSDMHGVIVRLTVTDEDV